ncbi:hypothetical protein [Fructobacillus parabroussonetiae]|uniref:Uncharacterized protein n=1 Tax=Fructobacillus parabroussonetiae TaxID=2713174 RepID=A0ABS5QXE6_9LACO|nr:hypothetical protein [Fructobacillus parabroussonetiae]MBS9337878.1 hypothetical protein [Fructobacillus parabroussonetiae]
MKSKGLMVPAAFVLVAAVLVGAFFIGKSQSATVSQNKAEKSTSTS